MDDIEIRRGYFPRSIGLVLELHARYYHAHRGGLECCLKRNSQVDSRNSSAAMMNFAMESGLPPSRGELRGPSLTVRTPLT